MTWLQLFEQYPHFTMFPGEFVEVMLILPDTKRLVGSRLRVITHKAMPSLPKLSVQII